MIDQHASLHGSASSIKKSEEKQRQTVSPEANLYSPDLFRSTGALAFFA
jgi:hypothetical protein